MSINAKAGSDSQAPYIAMGLSTSVRSKNSTYDDDIFSTSSESEEETGSVVRRRSEDNPDDVKLSFYPEVQRDKRRRGGSSMNYECKRDRKVKEKFRWKLFVRQLLYHFIGIPAIPFILYFEGRIAAINCDFFPGGKGRLRNFLVQTFFYSLYLVANVLYFLMEPIYISPLEIIVMDTLVAIRALTIAMKYATIPTRLLIMMGERILSMEEISQTLLLGGWTSDLFNNGLLMVHFCAGSDQIIEEEINNAERLLNLRLSSIHFVYNPHDLSFDRVLDALHHHKGSGVETLLKPPVAGGDFLKKEGYVGTIPARAVAFQIIHDSYVVDKMKFKNAVWVVLVRATLTLVLPYLLHGRRSLYFDTMSLVVTLCMTPVVYLYYTVDLLFLLCALHDFRRRKFAMEQMYFLLTKRGYLPKVDQRGGLHFDLRQPDNVIAWLNLRHVLRSYGRRWKSREEFFIGVFFAFLVTLIVYVMVLYFLSGKELIMLKDMSIVAFDLIVFSIVFVRVLQEASQSNSIFLRHRKVLSAAEGTCRYELWLMKSPFVPQTSNDENGAKTDPKKRSKGVSAVYQCLGAMCEVTESSRSDQRASRLENSSMLLKSAQSVIEYDDLSHPVTVLGVPPSMNLARTLVGLTATALFAALQRLTGLK